MFTLKIEGDGDDVVINVGILVDKVDDEVHNDVEIDGEKYVGEGGDEIHFEETNEEYVDENDIDGGESDGTATGDEDGCAR